MTYLEHLASGISRRKPVVWLAFLVVAMFLCAIRGNENAEGASRSCQTTPPQAAGSSRGSSKKAVRVHVAPDVMISGEDERPRVETMGAANPLNANNLLAGVISFARQSRGTMCMAYLTHDGGASWDATHFPEQLEFGGADPQVAFTRDGTAIFLALCMEPNDSGATRAVLHAYRSEDEGRTWSEPFSMGGSYDHPMLTTDRSNSPFAGNLYVSVAYGRDYSLGVFRSEDDGRNWIGPVKFTDGGGVRGLNVEPMIVLSDGAVIAPYIEFPATTNQHENWNETHLWTVVSEDGCLSFSEPRKGPKVNRPTFDSANAFLGGWIDYAVDTSERYRDRIYAVWPDHIGEQVRTTISWSDDRGETWSEPRLIHSDVPDHVNQFQATIEVNRNGIAGVTWFSTCETTESEFAFQQYFVASVDGGETFTSPVRLSGAVSRPDGPDNIVPAPNTFRTNDGALRVSTFSATRRWRNGGDYIANTSDSNGVFHPIWPDARSGGYQLFTSRVTVLEGDDATSAAIDESSLNLRNVTASIEIVSDPGSYDRSKKELTWWIRLKNNSSETIYGPIEVEVQSQDENPHTPKILNATNSDSSKGVVFVYDDELGSAGMLEPGGVSGAKQWKIKYHDHLQQPAFDLNVSGRQR